MEKIIKKLFFATSALVAVSLALAPVTAYLSSESVHAVACRAVADKSKTCQDDSNTTLSVKIESNLTLDVGEVAPLPLTPGSTGTGTIPTKVTANRAYNITLNAENESATSLNGGSGTIPIPAATDFSAAKSGWGIKKKTDTGDADGYTEITVAPVVFYTGTATNNQAVSTDFTFGIGVAPNQAPGAYSTEVIVTLSAAS